MGEDEVLTVVESVSERLFLTTPLNDFTVTEGLLLIIALLLVLSLIIKLFKR